jgi:hypothetical protein
MLSALSNPVGAYCVSRWRQQKRVQNSTRTMQVEMRRTLSCIEREISRFGKALRNVKQKLEPRQRRLRELLHRIGLHSVCATERDKHGN